MCLISRRGWIGRHLILRLSHTRGRMLHPNGSAPIQDQQDHIQHLYDSPIPTFFLHSSYYFPPLTLSPIPIHAQLYISHSPFTSFPYLYSLTYSPIFRLYLTTIHVSMSCSFSIAKSFHLLGWVFSYTVFLHCILSFILSFYSAFFFSILFHGQKLLVSVSGVWTYRPCMLSFYGWYT